MGKIQDFQNKISLLESQIWSAKINEVNKVRGNAQTSSELKNILIDPVDQKLKATEIIRPGSIDPVMLALDTSILQYSIQGAMIEWNAADDSIWIAAGVFLSHNFYAIDRTIIKKTKEIGSYNPARSWLIAQQNIALPNFNGYWLYLRVALAGGVTNSEILVDQEHIESKRDEGYLIYKLGYLQSVFNSKREVSMLFGNVKGGSIAGTNGREIEMSVQTGNFVWHYIGEAFWRVLCQVPANGMDGNNGINGREVQLAIQNGYVSWRYMGDVDWYILTSVASLTGTNGTNGTNGRQIELNVYNASICWRYFGDTTWSPLIPLASLTGANGTNGIPVEISVQAGWVSWRYVGTTVWIQLYAVPASAVTPLQLPGITLASASWALVSGLYEYNLANASITANSMVDVIPDNANIDIVKAAVILPKTVSSAGSVKMYATNAPTANIGITITITYGTL